MSVEMKEVKSSTIKKIGYDPETKVLRIQFKNDSIYDYEGFQEEDFKKFDEADSKGSYLAKNIKNKFSFKKVIEPPVIEVNYYLLNTDNIRDIQDVKAIFKIMRLTFTGTKEAFKASGIKHLFDKITIPKRKPDASQN